VTPYGNVLFEKKETSHQVFSNTALAHVVIPYELAPVYNAWSKEVQRLQADGAPQLYQLRLVKWIKLWLVVTVNFRSMYSLAVVADDFGYELSQREFTQLCSDGRRELFPFTSPTFRTLRPPMLLLENN